jgi:NAD(P)-dependent dehydrogenase (short-subunit alcohol dehydrogenase family)
MLNILVTGSSTGIGLATVLHLAGKGHRLFASLRNPEAAEELQAAVRSGLPITPVQIDVDDDASVKRGVAEVLATAQVDVLVNNAGIGGGGPVELASIDRAKQTFETNYFGAVRMMQALLPGFRERRSGTIVNVTSVAGRVALAGHSHYAASKFALEALSESTAAEVSRLGIRIAIIEPGVVLTPIFGKSSSQAADLGLYEVTTRRLWKFFEKQLENPTMPLAVAEAIEHAITTDKPQLRYLVGKDAETLMLGRERMSDEAWVAAHSAADDDAYYDRMVELLGTDLFR